MICLISGTNRPGSQTLRVTKIYQKIFQKEGAQTTLLDLNKLPIELFNPTAYGQKPAVFETEFNKPILESQGLFVVTPEYNGSFPGVLKYFVDMLKFPQSFENRAVAFTGIAAGRFGALRSVEQLQMIFGYRNARLFNERVFIPGVEDQISENNEFKDPFIKDLVQKQVKGFVDFCKRLS